MYKRQGQALSWKIHRQCYPCGIRRGLPDGALFLRGAYCHNDVAVFTAMCMCWSGYLSTHVAMMDSLKFRNLTGQAILYHTIGGLFAGVSAHFIYMLIT